MKRRIIGIALLALVCGCTSKSEELSSIECGPDSIGTSRVISVTAKRSIHDQLREKEVVLTYDDGPHRQETSRVLKVLAKECVQATFFLLGRKAEDHPNLVRLIHEQGHTLGGHSWSHPSLVKLAPKQAHEEISRGNAAIEAAVQSLSSEEEYRVRLFRYPFLHLNDDLSEYLETVGVTPVWVHADGSDWTGQPAKDVVDEIFSKLERSGDKGVVLLHPPTGSADDATRILIERLKAEDYSIAALKPAD